MSDLLDEIVLCDLFRITADKYHGPRVKDIYKSCW